MFLGTQDASFGLRMRIEESAPVVRFSASLNQFKSQHKPLGERLTRHRKVRWTTGQRLLASGNSVIAFNQPLVEAHIQAVIAYLQSSFLLEKLHSVEVPPPPYPPTAEQFEKWVQSRRKADEEFQQDNGRSWWEVVQESHDVTAAPYSVLHACHQAHFFLLRAYQDRAYAAIIELLGAESGYKAGMQNAFDKNGSLDSKSPVGSFLASHCSEYGAWFAHFRKVRNDLKFGTPTGTSCGPGLDIGFCLNQLNEKNKGIVVDIRQAYRLGHAADALDRSATLIAKIADLCESQV